MTVRINKMLSVLPLVGLCTGCGTITPNIQEFWGDYKDAARIERNLVGQVSCELRQAVWYIVANNRYNHSINPKKIPLRYEYLKDWVAQIQLLISIEEKSSFGASFDFINPLPANISNFSGGRTVSTGQSFSLGSGLGYTSGATRIDKIFLNYKVKDFINSTINDRTCLPKPAEATLFIQSDLKIYEWLYGMLDVPVSQGPESEVEAEARLADKPDVLSHDIKFEIVTTGGVSPIWKLVPFGASGSPALSLSRDRVQQLVITLAPPDKPNSDQLGPSGQNASLASQISSSLTSAFRRN